MKIKKSNFEIPWWHDYFNAIDKTAMLAKLPALKEINMSYNIKRLSKKKNREMAIRLLSTLFDDAISYGITFGGLKHENKKK